jgi:hypothetical protein
MAHQSARASSTGGQGGQLHLVAASQPHRGAAGKDQATASRLARKEAWGASGWGGGSWSALDVRGRGGRHRSSLPGQEWSARPLAQEGRFHWGAGARPCGAGASCPGPLGSSARLRSPVTQSPGSWRALGYTRQGCEGGRGWRWAGVGWSWSCPRGLSTCW